MMNDYEAKSNIFTLKAHSGKILIWFFSDAQPFFFLRVVIFGMPGNFELQFAYKYPILSKIFSFLTVGFTPINLMGELLGYCLPGYCNSVLVILLYH